MEDIKKKLLEIENEIEDKFTEPEPEGEEIVMVSIHEYSNRLAVIWNELMDLWRKVVLKKERKKEHREKLLILKDELEKMESKLRYTELYKRWKDTMDLVREIEKNL